MSLDVLVRLLREEDGATAIEYALVASLVALATLSALFAMGTSVADLYGAMAEAMFEAAGLG